MKKWLCALSVCTVASLGAVGFAGCGANNDEVAGIKMKTLPTTTQFTVGDVITPALHDGVFTIEYANGRTSDMHLNYADIVYIDYADGTTSNEFSQANQAQKVVVRYKSKVTTFNVNVAKKDLQLDYTKVYQKTYTGERLPLDDMLVLGVPHGVSVSQIEYRLRDGSTDGVYGSAPTDAGVYDVRVALDGGTKYNNIVLDDITYTIEKADVSLALKTNYIKYCDLFMNYGDEVDATHNWQLNATASKNNIFTNALRGEYIDLANNIQYAYRLNSQKEYTILHKQNGKVWLNDLPTGSYKLRAYANDLPNFQNFYYECDLSIAAKPLQYGVDYRFVVSDGVNAVDYEVPVSAMNIPTTIATDDPSSVSVRVELLNDNIKNQVLSTPAVNYVYSEPNMANWRGEGAIAPTAYGDYKIVILAEFRNDICYFADAFHGIKIVEE